MKTSLREIYCIVALGFRLDVAAVGDYREKNQPTAGFLCTRCTVYRDGREAKERINIRLLFWVFSSARTCVKLARATNFVWLRVEFIPVRDPANGTR